LQTILRPTVFNAQVSAFDVAGIRQTAANRSDIFASFFERPGFEITDHGHPRLLRARHERPRYPSAANHRDESAALHVVMAPAWQEISWRAAERSLAVMCPACWCSPGGLLALMGSANRVLIIRTGSMSR